MLLDTLTVNINSNATNYISGLNDALGATSKFVNGQENAFKDVGAVAARAGDSAGKSFSQGLSSAGSAGANSLADNLTTRMSAVSTTIFGMFNQLGAKITNSLSSSFSAGALRYDTLQNFPKIMQNIGISLDDANAARARLVDGLQGLPTTLNEGALAVQRFTVVNRDIGKSTEYYLALNNAVLASAAPLEDQAYALDALTRAYSEGGIDSERWFAIQTRMPAVIDQVAKTFGMSSDEMGKALTSGSMSMEDFMSRLTELNDSSTAAAYGITDFATQAKDATKGVQTSMKNLGTAWANTWDKILKGLGEGPNNQLVAFFENMKNLVNSLGTELGNFAGEALKPLFSQINDFLSNNKEEIVQFVKSLLSGIAQIAKIAAELVIAIMPLITDIFQWIADNGELVKSAVVGIIGAFMLFKGIKAISGVIGTIRGIGDAIGSLFGGKGSGSAGTGSVGSSFSPSNVAKMVASVGIVVAGVTAIVAGFSGLAKIPGINEFIGGGATLMKQVFDTVIDVGPQIAIATVAIAAFAVAADKIKSVNVGGIAKSMIMISEVVAGITVLSALVGGFDALTGGAIINGLDVIQQISDKIASAGVPIALAAAAFGIAGALGPGAIAAVGIGAAVFAAVLAGITLIAAAYGALKSVDGFEELINGGFDVLADIANGIGRFAGSIAGGFIDAVSDSVLSLLPKLGESLSGFAKSARPFFSIVQDVPDNFVDKCTSLALGIAALMADSVLSGLAALPQLLSNVSMIGLRGFVSQSVGIARLINEANVNWSAFSKNADSFVEGMSALERLSALTGLDTLANMFSGTLSISGLQRFVSEALEIVRGLGESGWTKKLVTFKENASLFVDGMKELQKMSSLSGIMSLFNKFSGDGIGNLKSFIFGSLDIVETLGSQGWTEKLNLFKTNIKPFSEGMMELQKIAGLSGVMSMLSGLSGASIGSLKSFFFGSLDLVEKIGVADWTDKLKTFADNMRPYVDGMMQLQAMSALSGMMSMLNGLSGFAIGGLKSFFFGSLDLVEVLGQSGWTEKLNLFRDNMYPYVDGMMQLQSIVAISSVMSMLAGLTGDSIGSLKSFFFSSLDLVEVLGNEGWVARLDAFVPNMDKFVTGMSSLQGLTSVGEILSMLVSLSIDTIEYVKSFIFGSLDLVEVLGNEGWVEKLSMFSSNVPMFVSGMTALQGLTSVVGTIMLLASLTGETLGNLKSFIFSSLDIVEVLGNGGWTDKLSMFSANVPMFVNGMSQLQGLSSVAMMAVPADSGGLKAFVLDILNSGIIERISTLPATFVSGATSFAQGISALSSTSVGPATAGLTELKAAIDNAENSIRSITATAAASQSGFASMLNAVRNLQSGVSAATSHILASFNSMRAGLSSLVSSFYSVDLYSAGYSIGRNGGEGLASGLRSMWGSVYSAASSLANAATLGATITLRVQSPSKVFENIGNNVVYGLVNGIDNMKGLATSTVASLSREMTDQIEDIAAGLDLPVSFRKENISGELTVNNQSMADIASLLASLPETLREAVVEGVKTLKLTADDREFARVIDGICGKKETVDAH